MNDILSICIPTYNRKDKLEESIKILLEVAPAYEIGIYISDNASSDGTQEMVLRYQEEYPLIFYHRNKINLGFHVNAEKGLRRAKSKYCWLLGDDDLIVIKEFSNILNILIQGDYRLVVVNGGDYNRKNSRTIDCIGSKVYCDSNELLEELGPYMSWMSCLIFEKSMLSKLDFLEYKDNAFPHLLAIFQYFSHENTNVYWYSSLCVFCNSYECSYMEQVFRFFCKDWLAIAEQLTSYTNESKMRFLHGSEENKWGIMFFLYMREKGAYNYTAYTEYKKYFKFKTNINVYILLAICFLPRRFLSLLKMMKKALNSKREII